MTLPNVDIYDGMIDDADDAFPGSNGLAVTLPQKHGTDHNEDFIDATSLTSQTNQNSFETQNENDALDPILLPQSTHALLFSEPILSLPFLFGLLIMLLSFVCLGLAFGNCLSSKSIPVNVTFGVRAAQYLSIFVALLMEQEIPTGFYLLRMIPQQSLQQKFPRIKYNKFVFSSCVRILNGYFFLANVMLVLVFSNGVLEIFYDVLALQFVQQLDDIAFALAKMDMFGKRLQRACMAKCFRAEFGQSRLGRNKNVSRLLKGLTAFNCAVMLLIMTLVSGKQIRGEFQAPSISVKFGKDVWETAWARKVYWRNHFHDKLGWQNSTNNKTVFEERTLIYSLFNGVYTKTNKTEHGRPVYLEARKFDDGPYEKITPASFQYCKDLSAWVFMHPYIRKSQSTEPGCKSNWLLRSPDTYEYNLLSVTTGWQVWVGIIGNAEIDMISNKCKDASDCNLNGVCNGGTCVCNQTDGVRYLGTHCEVTLPVSCQTIVGEFSSDKYQIKYLRSWNETSWPNNEIETAYSRPVYHQMGATNGTDVLMYLGDRYYGAHFPVTELTQSIIHLYVEERHAFWFSMLEEQEVRVVSDPTTRSTPVGVDFYRIVDKSEQSMPRGALQPIQPDDITGKGYFRCVGPANNTDVARKL